MSSLKAQQEFEFITDYAHIATSLGELLNEKQAAYGDAFGNMDDIFSILYPEGISPHQYQDKNLFYA